MLCLSRCHSHKTAVVPHKKYEIHSAEESGLMTSRNLLLKQLFLDLLSALVSTSSYSSIGFQKQKNCISALRAETFYSYKFIVTHLSDFGKNKGGSPTKTQTAGSMTRLPTRLVYGSRNMQNLQETPESLSTLQPEIISQ